MPGVSLRNARSRSQYFRVSGNRYQEWSARLVSTPTVAYLPAGSTRILHGGTRCHIALHLPGPITFSRYTRTASGVLLRNAKPRSDFRRDAKALCEMFGAEERNTEVLWAAELALEDE